MTYNEFAEKHKLKLEIHLIPFRKDLSHEDENDPMHKDFAYKLRVVEGERFNKTMTGFYSQGSAIKGKPEIKDILNAVSLDTQGIDTEVFEDWASAMGYDSDSRKAFAIWQACIKEFNELKELLGSEGLEELHNIEQL